MDNILNYNRDASDDYYSILGCEESSTEEQIITEFKVRALDLHPDKNPDDPSTVEKFQKLQRAKEILTDPEKRKLYNSWRRSGLAMPFDQWQNLSKGCHTSMHWACKKQKDLMLKTMSETCSSHSTEEKNFGVSFPSERNHSNEDEIDLLTAINLNATLAVCSSA